MRNENFEDYLKQTDDYAVLLNNYGSSLFIHENGVYRALPVRVAYAAWVSGGDRWGEVQHLKGKIKKMAERAAETAAFYHTKIEKLESSTVKKAGLLDMAEQWDGLELRGRDLELNRVQESIYKRCAYLLRVAVNG